MHFAKVEYVAELLHLIALDCIGVPNKVKMMCNMLNLWGFNDMFQQFF